MTTWNVHPETSGVLTQTMTGLAGAGVIQGASIWDNVAVPASTEQHGWNPFDYLPQLPQILEGINPLLPGAANPLAPDSINPGFFGAFNFGSALARVSIIVLGFIFVAVGLSMFGAEPIKAAVAKITPAV